MRTNLVEKREDRKTPKKIGPFKKIFFLLVGGILLGVGMNTLVLSDSLQIKTIEIIENGQPQNQHPMEMLLQDLKGSNLLWLRTKPFEENLKQKYPIYETLEIKKTFPDALIVNAQKFAPIATLTVEISETEEKQTFSLNAQGHAMENESGETLPQIRIESESPIEIGNAVILKDHLAFALESIQAFEDKFGMDVEFGLYLKNEREFHLWTKRKFAVWLDMMADLDSQLNKLKQALPKLNIYEENLEYIDLRITGINGEKVIYKKK